MNWKLNLKSWKVPSWKNSFSSLQQQLPLLQCRSQLAGNLHVLFLRGALLKRMNWLPCRLRWPFKQVIDQLYMKFSFPKWINQLDLSALLLLFGCHMFILLRYFNPAKRVKFVSSMKQIYVKFGMRFESWFSLVSMLQVLPGTIWKGYVKKWPDSTMQIPARFRHMQISCGVILDQSNSVYKGGTSKHYHKSPFGTLYHDFWSHFTWVCFSSPSVLFFQKTLLEQFFFSWSILKDIN